MQPFYLTLKNYRCFEDSQPLRLYIGPGFTSLVGPNNSGKSSLLKFFYEMRHIFAGLTDPSTLFRLVEGQAHNLGSLQGVDDPEEIFCNLNRRPLTVELDFPMAQHREIKKVRLTMERQGSAPCKGELYIGQDNRKLVARDKSGSSSGVQLGFVAEGNLVSVISIQPILDVWDMVGSSIYIGPFRNAISEGSGTYYDLAIGTQFISTWNNWKTGGKKSQNEGAQAVADDIAHIFEYRRFEINATSDQKALQVIIDGKSYRLRELGAGLAQFIIVFGNVAINKPAFLLIDEPELNLHPSLQADFLTSLASYTREGVIFATHSIGLARTIGDRLYSFQKNEGKAVARLFEQTTQYAEFAGEMSFSAFKELGHDTVLLVEGVTEVKAVQQFLRVLGKDHIIVVIPLGGRQLIKGGVQAELAELKRLSQNIAVLIDSERTQAGASLETQRATFVQECQTLGFKVCVTNFRAFENYLPQHAIQAVLGPKYQALGPYDSLRNAPLPWDKNENWRIAREMTRSEILTTDIGAFLDNLV